MRRAALAAAAAAAVAIAALAPSASPGAAAKTIYFKPVMKKVNCAYIPAKPARIRCDLNFQNDRAVVATKTATAKKVHVTDSVANAKAKQMTTDHNENFGPFTCSAAKDDLNCHARATGHGFTITRTYQKLF
jgi:hypothetical protein